MEKKLYTDVMIDIETVGSPDEVVAPAIVQISAVGFYRDSGVYDNVKPLNHMVSLKSCLNVGMEAGEKTIIWWMKQDEAAREAVFGEHLNRIPIERALFELIAYVKMVCADGVRVWGNGPAFDLAILKAAFVKCGMDVPWMHYNERCVRTVVDLWPEIKQNRPFVGTKHNAVDDCVHQIGYLCETFRCVTPPLTLPQMGRE